MPAQLDIPLQRNEDYAASWFLTDDADLPLNLTGMTVAMQVRDKLTNQLFATGDVTIVDAENGEISVILLASAGAPLSSYGPQIQVVNLPYDLRLTDAAGINKVLVAGLVILSRGSTLP